MNQEIQEVEAVQAAEVVATADEKAVDTTVSETAADDGVEKEKQEERRFTQAELDAAIQKRLLKEERRVHRRVEQQLREQAQRQTAAEVPAREAFRSDDEYLQAQIEHIAAKKAEALFTQREQQKQIEQRNETFQLKAEAVAERLPDFDQVVGNPNLRITDGMAEFLTDSDVGPVRAMLSPARWPDSTAAPPLAACQRVPPAPSAASV
jgi:hypothetical protein